MYQINCPSCRKPFPVTEIPASGIVACPHCGQQMRVAAPRPQAVPPPPPAAPPPEPENPFAGLGNDPGPASPSAPANQFEFARMVESASREEEASRQQELLYELPEDLPPAVQKLGQPRVIYRSEKKSRQFFRRLQGAGVILSLLALVSLRVVRSAELAAVIVFGSLGLVALVGIAVLLYLLTQRRFRLIFYDEAMVHLKGRSFTIFRFEDIEDVFHQRRQVYDENGNLIRVNHKVIVYRQDGRSLQFDNTLTGVERVSARIRHEALRMQLPKALERIRRGETLKLGPFQLSEIGLEYKGNRCTWDVLEVCTIVSDTIYCKRLLEKKPFAEVDIDRVPRAFLVVAVADHYTGGRSNSEPSLGL